MAAKRESTGTERSGREISPRLVAPIFFVGGALLICTVLFFIWHQTHNADYYDNRGDAYYSKTDYDKAISDYTEAIRLSPHDPSYYAKRGDAYRDKKDYDKAIIDNTEVIRLKPDYAVYYSNRGNAYDAKKDCNRAEPDFAKAEQLKKAGQ